MEERIERVVRLNDIVKIYKDPETELFFEGHALVWAILEVNEEFYVLQVSFFADPAHPGRKFTRKHKRWTIKTEKVD